MNPDIYAPPRADLTLDVEQSASQRFYVVSKTKLFILFFATVGFYQIYWNWKNWRLHNAATDEGVWPIPRAIFSIFFQHSLFRNVADHDESGKAEPWDSSGLATTMVIVLIISNLTDRLAGKGIGSPFTDLAWMVLLLPRAYLLSVVQDQVNARCNDAAGKSNARFSAANVAWCAIGLVFWVLVAIGVAAG